MGRNKVKQPEKLSRKLKKIRQKLGLSQTELYTLLYPEKAELAPTSRGHISAYETGQRAPSLIDILSYVQILEKKAGISISTDVLINDKIELPF